LGEPVLPFQLPEDLELLSNWKHGYEVEVVLVKGPYLLLFVLIAYLNFNVEKAVDLPL